MYPSSFIPGNTKEHENLICQKRRRRRKKQKSSRRRTLPSSLWCKRKKFKKRNIKKKTLPFVHPKTILLL